MNKLGNFIIKKREQYNLTARKLAQMLDISASYLCDVEQGRKKPPFTIEKQSFYNGLIHVFCLDNDEINYMYNCVDEDLKDKDDAIAPDLFSYIKENELNMAAFREIKELNPSNDELEDAINYLKVKMQQKRLFIKDIDIDKKALNILKKDFPKYLEKPQAIDIELIIEKLGYNISCVTFYDRKILGMCTFDKQKIQVIDSETFEPKIIEIAGDTILFDEKNSEKDENRFRMTLAHELGHLILHKEIYKNKNGIMCRIEDIMSNYSGKSLRTDHDWEEHQANIFASSLLVPRPMGYKILIEASKKYEIPAMDKLNFMSIDERENIALKFSSIFKVSKQMARIRLDKLLNYIFNRQLDN